MKAEAEAKSGAAAAAASKPAERSPHAKEVSQVRAWSSLSPCPSGFCVFQVPF